MKTLYILVFSLGFYLIHSQTVSVSTPQSQNDIPTLLQQNITSSCSTIENITFKSGTPNNSSSIGSFSTISDSDFINEGVILSTDDILNSQGPNTGSVSGGINPWSTEPDSDLDRILKNRYNNAPSIIDVSKVEFDITAGEELIRLQYIFASDEIRDDNNYFDGFAILVNGPGIANDPGESFKNIALIPETNVPVGIESICSTCPYNAFHEDRTVGSGNEFEIGFEFSTKPLIAQFNAIPNETYHVKIVLGSRRDGEFESALFFKMFNEEDSFDLDQNFYLCSADETQLINLSRPSDNASTTFSWLRDSGGGNYQDMGISDSSANLEPGNYRIEKKRGQCTFVKDFSVFGGFDLATTLPDEVAICGSQTELSVISSAPNVNYRWTQTSPTNQLLSSGSQNSVFVNQPGIYEVEATYTSQSGSTCSQSYAFTVISSTASYDLTYEVPDPCSYPFIINLENFSSNFDSFFLVWENGAPAFLNASNTASRNVFSPGQYFLTMFSSCGIVTQRSIVIDETVPFINPAPPLIIRNVCVFPLELEGNSYSDGAIGANYLWTKVDDGTTYNTENYDVPEAGFYNLQITTTEGCEKFVQFEIKDIPPEDRIQSINECSSTASLNVSLSEDEVMRWLDINSSINPRLVNSNGTYVAEVTNNVTKCSYTVTFNVNLIDQIEVSFPKYELHNCIGNSAVIEANIPNIDNYNISFSYTPTSEDNRSTPNQSSSLEKNQIEISVPGKYFLTATDPLSGCSGIDSVRVITNDFNFPARLAICEGGSGIPLDATIEDPNAVYSWNLSPLTSPVINATQEATYTATATTDLGCSIERSIDIHVLSSNKVFDTIIYVSRDDSTFINPISPNAENTIYRWDNGFEGRRLQITESGSYFVTVSNQNCNVVEQINATVIRAKIKPTYICKEGESVIIDASHYDDTPGIDYSWEILGQGQILDPDNDGKIEVSVPELFYKTTLTYLGRSVSDSLLLLPLRDADKFGLRDDFYTCPNNDITIGSTLIQSETIYKWSKDGLPTGQTTPFIDVNESGIYELEASVFNCLFTDQLEVTQFQLTDIQNVKICANDDQSVISINSNHESAFFTWNTGDVNDSIIVTDAGLYSVTGSVFLPDGRCDITKGALVEEYLPEITDVSFIDGFNVKVEAENEFLPLKYGLEGTNLHSESNIVTVPSGIHFVEVIDPRGCKNQQPVSVPYIPNFFSPNRDGVNDIWRIKDLEPYPEALISIYDSSGTLIKRFKHKDFEGFGGDNSKGFKAPTGVYSYNISLPDGRVYKGRLLMKRY